MLKAADIMTREVFTVAPQTSVDELAKIFVEMNKNALPVVDDAGILLGVVTQTDLVEQDKPLHIPTVISIFDWVFYLDSEKRFREEVKKITARNAGDICNKEPITCREDTSVSEVARLMVEEKAHLIPVVDENHKVLGVVARLDIVRTMNI